MRLIPLDGRPHIPHDVRLWNGDSRGQWEHSTLAVDTTNFVDKVSARSSHGPPSAPSVLGRKAACGRAFHASRTQHPHLQARPTTTQKFIRNGGPSRFPW